MNHYNLYQNRKSLSIFGSQSFFQIKLYKIYFFKFLDNIYERKILTFSEKNDNLNLNYKSREEINEKNNFAIDIIW